MRLKPVAHLSPTPREVFQQVKAAVEQQAKDDGGEDGDHASLCGAHGAITGTLITGPVSTTS